MKPAGFSCVLRPAHVCRVEINLGHLSILFDYGTVVAYDYHDGVKVLENLNPPKQRHVNQWRHFTQQKKVTPTELALGLLTALSQESENIHDSLLPTLQGEQ